MGRSVMASSVLLPLQAHSWNWDCRHVWAVVSPTWGLMKGPGSFTADTSLGLVTAERPEVDP